MGLYYNTFVCFGFYTINKMLKNQLDKACGLSYKELDDGLFIFVPHTYYCSKDIDKIIEQHEINRGYVKLDDVLNVFHLGDTFFDITNDEKQQIFRFMENNNICFDGLNRYIVEVMICTMEYNLLPTLTKKLLII